MYIMSGNDEFTAEFFDQASAAWMENKRKLNDCTYVYTCTHTYMTGKKCNHKVYLFRDMLCKMHKKHAKVITTTENHQ
jgi:hypothetical protein